MSDYTPTDLSRMRYYYPELMELFKKNPKSLCLRNGIAHIQATLGLPATVEAVDPLRMIQGELEERGIKPTPSNLDNFLEDLYR